MSDNNNGSSSHSAETFSLSNAKDALLEILNAIENDSKLKQLRETCANDMLKYIQTFLPHTMEIQFKIIAKYGFTGDNAGLINFTNRIKDLAIEDDNVANLFDNFKNMLIPPLNIRTQCV